MTRPKDIEFAATVSSAVYDPEQLSISWTSDLDGDLALPYEINMDGSYHEETYLSAGTHLIETTVEDPIGMQTTATITIDVVSQ